MAEGDEPPSLGAKWSIEFHTCAVFLGGFPVLRGAPGQTSIQGFEMPDETRFCITLDPPAGPRLPLAIGVKHLVSIGVYYCEEKPLRIVSLCLQEKVFRNTAKRLRLPVQDQENGPAKSASRILLLVADPSTNFVSCETDGGRKLSKSWADFLELLRTRLLVQNVDDKTPLLPYPETLDEKGLLQILSEEGLTFDRASGKLTPTRTEAIEAVRKEQLPAESALYETATPAPSIAANLNATIRQPLMVPPRARQTNGAATVKRRVIVLDAGDMPVEKVAKPSFSGETTLTAYPPTGRDKIALSFADMRGLQYGLMLNDTLIDFWIRLVAGTMMRPKDRSDRVHIMSNFFHQKLTAGLAHHNLANRRMRLRKIMENYKSIARWTRNVNLFEKDYVVVPIVDEYHWYLVVVSNPSGMIFSASQDSAELEANKDTNLAHAIVFDSLHMNADPKRKAIVPILRDYFELECEQKMPKGCFARERLVPIIAPAPQQSNFVDCGVFLLKYVEDFFSKYRDPSTVPNINWSTFFVNYMVRMPCYREFVRAKVRQLTDPEKWAAFEEYEEQHRRDVVAPETKEEVEQRLQDAQIDVARRPRRHSCSKEQEPNWMLPSKNRHANMLRRRRYTSLPASFDVFIAEPMPKMGPVTRAKAKQRHL
ncbi:unnamed protein product, partial [Mesorhabditis spiculigera]